MPTYEYECKKCGHTFDALQNMSDDPLTKCPACGKNTLRRLIGGGLGVIFKGSGFYVTDSRSSSSASMTKASTEKKNEPVGAGTGGKSESSSDSSSTSRSKDSSTPKSDS